MKLTSPIRHLTPEGIKENVDDSRPYVIVFLSEWCPACQEFKPIVEFFAEKYEGKVEVYIVRPENAENLRGLLPIDRIGEIPHTYFVMGKTILAEVPGAMRFHDFRTGMQTLYRTARPAG